MTLVLIERTRGYATLKDAVAYLRTHGFPEQHLLRPTYSFTEMVKERPFLVPHGSGKPGLSLWAYVLEEYVGTIEALEGKGGVGSFEGWDIEVTVYGPGVALGMALPSGANRRRAIRV